MRRAVAIGLFVAIFTLAVASPPAVDRAVALGVPEERIIVDPGHDLNKNTRHTLEITHENYLKNSIEVEIVPNEVSGPDMLNLLPIPATLTVTAPSGSAFWVEQEGEPKRKYRIPGTETTRSFRNLRPGRYRIWLDDNEEDAVNVELKARDDRRVEFR